MAIINIFTNIHTSQVKNVFKMHRNCMNNWYFYELKIGETSKVKYRVFHFLGIYFLAVNKFQAIDLKNE